MGLSACKQYGAARWALRVNPSSGNLHPTESYVIFDGRVCHYAPREHVLEERCVLDAQAWGAYIGPDVDVASVFFVALTSVHWREAWKYGERAFRYCQHDAGHAIATLRLAAARLRRRKPSHGRTVAPAGRARPVCDSSASERRGVRSRRRPRARRVLFDAETPAAARAAVGCD
jgi:nitroreductase